MSKVNSVNLFKDQIVEYLTMENGTFNRLTSVDTRLPSLDGRVVLGFHPPII